MKNLIITVRFIKFIQLVLITLLFTLTQFQSLSQSDSFVYFEDGEFFNGCDTFHMVGVNYPITRIVTPGDTSYISPDPDQCPWEIDCFSCGKNPNEWEDALIRHLNKIDSLGFNTIRVLGLSVKWNASYPDSLMTKRYFKQKTTNNHGYEIVDTGEYLTSEVHEIQGDIIQQLIDVIKDEKLDLKLVILLGGHGVEMLESDYASYLSYIANRFKNESTILGYDLYNEPVYEAVDNGLKKLDVNDICLNWYSSIKQYAPLHLVTIGSKIYDLFKWDPEILPVDFISFHPYAMRNKHDNWQFQPPVDRFKARLKYMHSNFTIPYIIGETGYSGTDTSRINCADPHPVIGSELEQKQFADFSTKYCRFYGYKGYTWWKYKDQPWHDCNVPEAIKNYWGLVFLESIATSSEEHKVVGNFFETLSPSNIDTSGCEDPHDSVYYNPTYSNQDTIILEGIIIDSICNEPLTNAFISAVIIKSPPDKSARKSEGSFAISNDTGYFKIKTSFDIDDPDLQLYVQASKPGWYFKDYWYGRHHIPSTQVQYEINQIDQLLIQQKPEYNAWTITSGEDITWTNSKYPGSKDIIIEEGATLTIKSSVIFRNNPKIIVKRGAKLVLDEGCILSTCTDNLWQGIEVWGNPNQPHTHDSLHGVVEIKNGAIIEKAKAAISTTRKNEDGVLVQGYHGGIVRADSAIFENNKRAVEIWPFDYTNESYFINSYFFTSAELPNNNSFEYFIIMSDIDGIYIKGCHFENTRPAFDYTMDGRGIGIFSNESQYRVSTHDPQGSNIENYFGKLKYGILANGFTPAKTPSIKDCSFEYNRTGIYLGGITSASVLSNYFLVESFDTAYDHNIFCGLYMDNSTEYHVEDNFFEHEINTNQNEDHTIGITVNNSGDQTNEIYRNTFKTLDIGILAQNQNRDENGDYGLTIKCSDFGDNRHNDPSLYDNTYDIAVTKDGICDYPGIKKHQGSGDNQSSPAGNKFSQASNGIVDSDYSNADAPRIFYWQHDPTNEPRINLTYHIPLHVTKRLTQYQYIDTLCCPPSLTTGGTKDLESLISGLQSDVDSVSILLSALVDGGNTQELESDVILSTPDQAYDLYTDLNMKSPYLTDTVMVEAVRKENVLNEVMVKEILVANPQSAKSDEVMNELDNRINPLPDYMITEIEQGNDSLGDKELMEVSKYYYLQRKNIYINNLKRFYKTDTSGQNSRDTLRNFLINTNSLQAKYELAFEYLLNRDYANSNAVISNIPYQFLLSSEENDLYQDYSDFIDIVLNLKQNNIDYYNIDSLQIDILDSLSNDIYSTPGAYARNILTYNDVITYNEPYILPDSTLKTEEFYQTVTSSNQEYPAFGIYPNPASNFVTIEYNLKNRSCNGYVEFIDVQGKIIRHVGLSTEKYSKIIQLNNDFSTGTYFCKFICNGQVIATEELIIIR